MFNTSNTLTKTNKDITKLKVSTIAFENTGNYNPRRIRFRVGDVKYVFSTPNIAEFDNFQQRIKTVTGMVGAGAEVDTNLIFTQLLEFCNVESIEVEAVSQVSLGNPFPQNPIRQWGDGQNIVNLPHTVTPGSTDNSVFLRNLNKTISSGSPAEGVITEYPKLEEGDLGNAYTLQMHVGSPLPSVEDIVKMIRLGNKEGAK